MKNQALVKMRNNSELQTDKCVYVSGSILKARESVSVFQQSKLEEASEFKRSHYKDIKENNRRIKKQIERKRRI